LEKEALNKLRGGSFCSIEFATLVSGKNVKGKENKSSKKKKS